jgi:hypothetical protein
LSAQSAGLWNLSIYWMLSGLLGYLASLVRLLTAVPVMFSQYSYRILLAGPASAVLKLQTLPCSTPVAVVVSTRQ